MEKLQGDITVEFGVIGAIDFAHAALAEQFGNLVVREGLSDQGDLRNVKGDIQLSRTRSAGQWGSPAPGCQPSGLPC